MDTHMLLASLHEHYPAKAGQHQVDEILVEGPDSSSVLVAVLAIVGIMLAILALDGNAAPPGGPAPSHLMMGNR